MHSSRNNPVWYLHFLQLCHTFHVAEELFSFFFFMWWHFCLLVCVGLFVFLFIIILHFLLLNFILFLHSCNFSIFVFYSSPIIDVPIISMHLMFVHIHFCIISAANGNIVKKKQNKKTKKQKNRPNSECLISASMLIIDQRYFVGMVIQSVTPSFLSFFH